MDTPLPSPAAPTWVAVETLEVERAVRECREGLVHPGVELPLVCFSTYGETVGDLHMNQTFTGIAPGAPR